MCKKHLLIFVKDSVGFYAVFRRFPSQTLFKTFFYKRFPHLQNFEHD